MTQQERKEIYEEMLSDFQKDEKYLRHSGFCAWLVRKFKSGSKADIENYPELISQRPKKPLVLGVYWWSISSNGNGREKRIEALKKAIKSINKSTCIQENI